MTHFTRTILAAVSLAPWLGLAACVDDPVETPAVAVRDRIYDFSPRRLDEARLAPLAVPASPKQQIRFVLSRALPDVAACLAGTNHPAGTVDVTLSIALEPDAPAVVGGVLVEAFGDVRLAACIRGALLEADVSAIESPAAPERWTIHAPLLVDANYTGKL
jgi:hypothetical protein